MIHMQMFTSSCPGEWAVFPEVAGLLVEHVSNDLKMTVLSQICAPFQMPSVRHFIQSVSECLAQVRGQGRWAMVLIALTLNRFDQIHSSMLHSFELKPNTKI